MYKWFYETPSGFDNMVMTSDGEYLTALVFQNSNDIEKIEKNAKEEYLDIFKETSNWLDLYFEGKIPDFIPSYKLENLSRFTLEVIEHIKKIPYGKVISYGDIANCIAKKKNIKRMSAQAVGGAVGRNPICIIIPCHRVMGTNNKITGYGGGINNKIKLLEKEGIYEYKK